MRVKWKWGFLFLFACINWKRLLLLLTHCVRTLYAICMFIHFFQSKIGSLKAVRFDFYLCTARHAHSNTIAFNQKSTLKNCIFPLKSIIILHWAANREMIFPCVCVWKMVILNYTRKCTRTRDTMQTEREKDHLSENWFCFRSNTQKQM